MAEGEQAEEHAERTSHEDHEHTDEQGHGSHSKHLLGVDEQTEEDEHHNLEQPRQAVEEGGHLLAVGNLGVADDHTGDVYRQVAIALEEVGERESEEGYRKHEDGVERLVVEVQLVDDIHGQLAHSVADGTTKHELLPEGALVMIVKRGTEFLVPNGSLHLQVGDKLLLISER